MAVLPEIYPRDKLRQALRTFRALRAGLLAGLLCCLCWRVATACPVAVDVGHFHDRPGATSARGVVEYDFNLALATRIRAALEQRGCKVILIGAEGDARELRGRTALARQASFFLSVHHDSVQEQFLTPWVHDGKNRRYTDQFAGFSLFVSRENPALAESLRCASTIGSALRGKGFVPSLYHAEAMPGEHRPFADQANGVHYFDGLVVLKSAVQPAVLLEAGVILNRAEEVRLSTEETRQSMAEAVASAVFQCVRAPATVETR